jgi:predicted MPP superfamily phosphohydrolase
MLIRFFIFLTLVVGLHAYLGLRLIAPADLPLPAELAAWAALVAMPTVQMVAMMGRFRGRKSPEWFTWVAFSVMGVFWLLLTVTFARDLVWWGLRLGGLLPVDELARTALFVKTNLGVLGLTSLGLIVGAVEARRTPRLRPVDVEIEDLPDALHGFTIAHITDLHIGDTIGPAFVEAVVQTTNGARPDMVALTGDIVDTALEDGRETAELLGDFDAPAYYVTGNHEYYVGAGPWIEALKAIGLDVLQNEHRIIDHDGAPLVVAGVPDRAGREFDPGHAPNFEQAAEGAPEGAVKIVLSHQPRTATDAARAGFDLQLSGHTHGGQMWPWSYFVRLQQPVVQGLAQVGRMKLWTSRGTGYWGPPLRVGAPSEISLVRLVPAA